MQIPKFNETNHPLITSLLHHSDQELLHLFQEYPEQGKYFIAIFCRYSPIVHTLIWHSARSAVQADYLFALTWRHIFYEMRALDLDLQDDTGANSFQRWLINTTAFCINQQPVPPVESINYNLKAVPPPLWCYLESSLSLLPPATRFILLMRENFHWSETRITAYLKAEGEKMSPAEVRVSLRQGYKMLEKSLPEDIRSIYLEQADNLSVVS